ncbi:hypothetical protein LPJ64_002661, partial [Coemansia asiatica]
PASPAPLSVPALETSFTQQEEADVAVSKTEIDRLVALIEAIPLPSETPTASASEPSNKPSDEDELILELQKTIDELQAQLSEQQKSAESAQITNKEQTAGLQQRIAQLEQELKDAAGARDQLQNELSEKTEQLITAANELDHAKSLAETVPELNKRIQQMQVTMTELQRELGENRDRLGKVQSELTAAQDDHAFLKQKLNDAEKERVYLASALAKAQGASIRLETQKTDLQMQLDSEKKRAEQTQADLDALRIEHTQTLKDADNQLKMAEEAERQLAEVLSTVASLEVHVRAVDADLANSREQFAEKSRLLAQATQQQQEMQYVVDKERRSARISADEAAKEIANVREQLAEVRRLAKEQKADDQKVIEKLRDQLGDLDQWANQASLVERLQAQVAEKEAELETLRSNLRSSEESLTALQIEVDRLRDVERDFSAVKEQLDRVAEERKLSEQRWKRLHRDLKEEVRRLHRERQSMQSASNTNAPLSPLPRSNSMTLASVSSLLRAATGNAAASTANGGIISGRRGSAQPPLQSSSSPSSSVLGRPARFPHQPNQGSLPSSYTDNTVALGTSQSDTGGSSAVHTRSSSNAGSSSDSVFGHDDFRADNVNVEYLRNVLFKFFNDKERRPQLVPVLSMLLHCKTDDIKQIQLMLQ